MVVSGLWWWDQEPYDIDDDLNDHYGEGDGELGLGRDAAGPFGTPFGGVEDPWDSVGLGQQCPIHNGETKADAKLLDSANTCGGSNLQIG